MYKKQLIFMTPPLVRSRVSSPSLYYRYGALCQRCTARPRAAHRYIFVSIAAQVEIGRVGLKTADHRRPPQDSTWRTAEHCRTRKIIMAALC